MPAERFARIESLFGAALGGSRDERSALLAAAAQDDPDLAAEVARLLAADERAGRFLEDAVQSAASSFLHPGEAGRRLGPYRLVRELGYGGMGAVFLAERDDRELDQRVAIKLLHRGLETAEIVARFRAERQILARLNHPAIARLFYGGTADDGRPYFVMEL